MLMKSGINALRCGCDQRRAMQMIHITIRMRYLLEHRKFLALAPVGCGGVRAAALTDSMSGKFCCDLNCATYGEEAIRAAHSRMHNFLKVNPYKKCLCNGCNWWSQNPPMVNALSLAIRDQTACTTTLLFVDAALLASRLMCCTYTHSHTSFYEDVFGKTWVDILGRISTVV
ncbi:hypothetical protein F2P81_011317 [Scophthalmus maximus]|uniref:Uncharacterized protein n=1 Tax=Scophthalmus maximus TaxID=52904 RepID=A0A6A4STK4_SCOMX|nr:hypothetical protein F2P81_011317 [Scophthalmus maximus]